MWAPIYFPNSFLPLRPMTGLSQLLSPPHIASWVSGSYEPL